MVAIFHRRLFGLIHSFPHFSQMALELKSLTVPNATDDLPDLLSLQFCPLISLPWPPPRILVMRKWAVVFVHEPACLATAPLLVLNGNKAKACKSLRRQCFRRAARSIVSAGKPERLTNRAAVGHTKVSAIDFRNGVKAGS